jgi:predicted anti-sigma-YlaC factor YlaD
METTGRPNIAEREFDCREIEELSDDFIDGELPADTRLLVDHHLQHCNSCRELISDIQMVINSAKELAQKPIPSAVHNRFREALKKQLGVELDAEVEHKLYLIKGGSAE